MVLFYELGSKYRGQGFYEELLILANNFLSLISGAQVNSAITRKINIDS